MNFDKELLKKIGIVIAMLALSVFIYLYAKYAKNRTEKMTNGKKLSIKDLNRYRALNVKMFTKDDCKFCKDTINNLSKLGLTEYTRFVNVSNPDGKREFDETGEIGVPCLQSEVTKKIKCGYTEDILEIISELEE